MKIDNQPPKSKNRTPFYISLLINVALIGGYFLIPDMRNWLEEAWDVLTSNNEKQIQLWVGNFGWFGPVLIILAMIAQMFLIVIPSWLLIVVAILAYGAIWGSVLSFIAIFAASTVGYYTGKYLGASAIMKLIGTKNEKKISSFLTRYGFWAIIITRINPMLSNDAISFMAGILDMNYPKFIASTMIGIIPLVIYIAILGELTTGLTSGLIWGSAVSLALFIGYVYYDKKNNREENKK